MKVIKKILAVTMVCVVMLTNTGCENPFIDTPSNTPDPYAIQIYTKDDLQDKDTMYNSKKYVLKSVEMEEADASGVYAKKATPYLVKERFFYGIRMTKIYVLSN